MKIIEIVTKGINWITNCGPVASFRQRRERRRLKRAKKLIKLQKENEITNYFLNLNYCEQEPEIREIIDYLSKNKFSVFPYSFIQNYRPHDVDVFFDDSNIPYVLHENKKLYFPNGYSPRSIRHCYNGLKLEQDKNSPHRYESDSFTVNDGDVIADVGAAEGIWALSNVEKAEKVYLIEREQKWIDALQKTFEPWKEKVVIVNKYVSDINDDENITLDNLLNGQKINVIKADIEGYELKMLEGGKEVFKYSDNLKLLLCTYHNDDDAEILKTWLEKKCFATEFSKGYMLFIYDVNLQKPYLRRGLIRAKKERR